MNFDDIINLPHFHAPGRDFMSNAARAAQFAPFKSLTGYEDEIAAETSRVLDEGDEEIILENPD